MLRAERQDRLIRFVSEKGIATVEELIRAAGSSEATIRRDINELSTRGLLEKVRGGAKAVTSQTDVPEPSFVIKSQTNAEEKKRIAREAVKLISPGEQIMLDSGTTTYALACELGIFQDLKIVTNDLRIALEISTNTSNKVVFLGGAIRDGFCSSYGYYAEAMLRNISADKIFLSIDALDPVMGIMSYTMDDVNLKILGMKNARETYVLADHSKFESRPLFSAGMLDQIDTVISGTELPEEKAEELMEAGLKVIRV
ncbi:MAG: DeoR/GlpR transcriptional regulator [Lachnospiraceae bacterium]|nr:DeoR/GlpR transcriptional regulator [Lachnospiraceae bacterium]